MQPSVSWEQVTPGFRIPDNSSNPCSLLRFLLGHLGFFMLSVLFSFFYILGSLNGQVIQTPQHLLKGKGQKAKMSCRPENGHTFVFWYQQKQNKELNFLISFQRQEVRERTDLVKERFLAECPLNSPCSLEIQSSEAGDSALYLCASSLSTALNCTFSLVHKPSMEATQEAGGVLGWKEVTNELEPVSTTGG